MLELLNRRAQLIVEIDALDNPFVGSVTAAGVAYDGDLVILTLLLLLLRVMVDHR